MGGGGTGTRNFAELLKILGADINTWKAINIPIRFRYIVLPDESFFHDEIAFFTQEYIETIEQIKNFALKNFTPISQKKFYFLYGQNQIGEERLADYLKSRGYETVRPENLPLQEQYNILLNCESFASTVGSCSHNSVFMKDNAEVILIPRSAATGTNPHQQALNQVSKLNINYVDSNVSLFAKDHCGPFCYIISKQLKKFFGDDSADEYTEEDFITFLQYVRASMSNGFQENLKLRKYYSGILAEFYSQLVQRKELMEKFGVFIK